MKKIVFIVIALITTFCVLFIGYKAYSNYRFKNIKESNLYSEIPTYEVDNVIFEKQLNVDYGLLEEDLEYYSTTAKDYKKCNVLLPKNYDKNTSYPVLYFIHGWKSSYKAHLRKNSYIHILYGNMLDKNLAKPMIIVSVDMYTDKESEKSKKTDEELRFIYDKVIDDIAVDVMPFIEKKYNVLKGRDHTAVAGVSQGGAEALATGFKYLDKFSYIAAIAPDPGVIPTDYYKGTFWNTPIFEEFPKPNKENMPKYIYLPVGTDDPWNIETTKYYSKVLTEMNIKNQLDVVPGYAHNKEFWKITMYNFLYKVFK